MNFPIHYIIQMASTKSKKSQTSSSKALVDIENILTLSECVTQRRSIENQTEVPSPSDE